MRNNTPSDSPYHPINSSARTFTPVPPPFLTCYRPNKNLCLILNHSAPPTCTFFTESLAESICDCEKTKSRCKLLLGLFENIYDWEKDLKFKQTYKSYARLGIPSVRSELEIETCLNSKLKLIGVQISQNCRKMLTRIVLHYLKHLSYYELHKNNDDNDLAFWFTIGLSLHSRWDEEEFIFWGVEVTMKALGDLTTATRQKHIAYLFVLLKHYFPDWLELLTEVFLINLAEIFREWIDELFMGYMGVQFVGLHMKQIVKGGWRYVYQLALSFFEKQMEKIVREDVMRSYNKQIVLKYLLEDQAEWPLVFCNVDNFKIQCGRKGVLQL